MTPPKKNSAFIFIAAFSFAISGNPRLVGGEVTPRRWVVNFLSFEEVKRELRLTV